MPENNNPSLVESGGSHLATYMVVFGSPDVKGPFEITVDGKPRYSDLTEVQAEFYFAGLNIFNGHTAALKKNGKIIARKGESN
jgi:hypothetical protein